MIPIDGHHHGADALAPVPESVNNQLKAGVAADKGWCGLQTGEPVQHSDDVFGLATPANSAGEAKAPVLIDDIQGLELPPLGTGVALESMAHT